MSTKPNKIKETTDVTGGNYIRVIQGDPAQNKVIPVTNLFSDPDVIDILQSKLANIQSVLELPEEPSADTWYAVQS